MATRPDWREVAQFPVVAGTGLIAVAVTLAWWKGINISPLFESAEIRRGELWRIVTNVFPHIDIFHLIFNLYWLWIFGSIIEQTLGHLKIFLLLVFLSAASGAWDFAFASGGVGLSGAGYGLFGVLYVLSKHDERFKDTLDNRTINLFIGWFFLCVVLTLANVWRVANVAHAAGAVFGLLIGCAIVFPKRRRMIEAAIAILFAAGLAGATFARPYINVSKDGGYEEGKWGYDAIIAKNYPQAIRWQRQALRYKPNTALFWFNLGVAYQDSGDTAGAAAAFQRAHELEPSNDEYAQVADYHAHLKSRPK